MIVPGNTPDIIRGATGGTTCGPTRGTARGVPRGAGFLIFVLLGQFISGLDIDPILAGEFWVELSPFVQTEDEYPLSEEEAHRRILEEAQYVFSGIIYGFTFVYTPSDRTREVDEIFDIAITAQIPWGDPALSIVEVRSENNLLHALVRYTPIEHQLRWLRMMGSNVYPGSTGVGTGSLFLGVEQKTAAMSDGVKEAIRAYLRSRILNKPKEIRGKAVFTEVPYVIINEGTYSARVSVKIDIDEIIPYRIY
ncbi:MAG: hypothetical protein HN368_00935 [Spirochaetales bacterium]|jgi:hypothetical protein|nr:hypothetical protein [Spirochaetales bacterium]